MFSEIDFIAWRLFFFVADFIFAVPQCPIEFPALRFPTEHRPHLVLVGECFCMFLWKIVGILLLLHPEPEATCTSPLDSLIFSPFI